MVFTSTTPFRWDDGDVDGAVGGGVVLLVVASRHLVFGPFRFLATHKDRWEHEKQTNVQSPATKGECLM